jgi:hypothetical protein
MVVSVDSQNGQLEHPPVPVAQPARPVAQRSRLMVALPLPRSPVTAAAGGLTAGALFVTLIRVLTRRRQTPFARRRGRKGLERSIAGSRSFLVDVHLLR